MAGIDRLTLTFAVEDVDFSLSSDRHMQHDDPGHVENDACSPWRSGVTDRDDEYWADVEPDLPNDLPDDFGFVEDRGEGYLEALAADMARRGWMFTGKAELPRSTLFSNPWPTGRWRQVAIGPMRVHVSVFERTDLASWTRRDAGGSQSRGLEARGRRWWASVSFNPARLYDPNGWTVCPAADARGVACAVLVHLARTGVVVPVCQHINEASSEVIAGPREATPTGRTWCQDVDCMLQNVSVSRVDATMDFLGVQSTKLWVDALVGHRQQGGRWYKHRYSDLSANVQHGQNGLRVAVYDKREQARATGKPKSAWAPEGTLRVEVRARSPKLQKVMTPEPESASDRAPTSRRLEDLTPALVRGLFSEGFDWAGLDRWIGGEHPLTPGRRGGLSATTARRLRTFLDDRENGRPRNEVVDNTTRRYERLSRQYGYVLGVPRKAVTGPVRHLDVVTEAETKPSLPWRLKQGFVGVESGASRTVITRRPQPH